jgi:tRNA (cmo5U34)-methyltransferase
LRDELRTQARPVGEGILTAQGGWSFGGPVAEVFDRHIERSVPGYREGHDLVARLSDWFLPEGAAAVEIGCATGALLSHLAEWTQVRDVRIVGIEIEEAMVEAARRRCEGLPSVEVRHGDALTEPLGPCTLAVSYYTVQFVRPADRLRLLRRIHAALDPGGALVMFEKVRAPDARLQDILGALHVDFKLEQGFDEAEIVHKARSLKGVLEPLTTQANLDLLGRAGFRDRMTVFKRLCFEGFLAIK